MYDYSYGHSFGQFAFAFWWLIFPLMWFVFGLMRMWMRYRQHRDTLEVMRSYAAQGRDPSELAKTLQTTERRWPEHKDAPGGEWRCGVILLCVSAAFAIALYYGMLPGTEGPFRFVALITGLIGVALLVTAIVTKTFMSGSVRLRPRPSSPGASGAGPWTPSAAPPEPPYKEFIRRRASDRRPAGLFVVMSGLVKRRFAPKRNSPCGNPSP